MRGGCPMLWGAAGGEREDRGARTQQHNGQTNKQTSKTASARTHTHARHTRSYVDVFDGAPDVCAHGALHAVDQALQPRLDVAARLDRPLKRHALALRARHAEHAAAVGGVKRDVGERVEEARLEVRHDARRVAAERQDLEQRRVGHKVEAAR